MLKFSCEKALLQLAVNTASRTVATKSSIPGLEGLLLEGTEVLTLSGYNMQTGIRTPPGGRHPRAGAHCAELPAFRGHHPQNAR